MVQQSQRKNNKRVEYFASRWMRSQSLVAKVSRAAMEQLSALPSINGKLPDQPVGLKVEVPATRPTSSVATGGRRALGILPKSAGAVSRRTRHSEGSLTSSWQSYESQAQRPSSMQVSSRGGAADRMMVRVFTSTTRQAAKLGADRDSHFSQTQQQEEGDSRNEVQHLRDENATFRHENDVLRTKLVEKMRGQSKVVAGGQFRAASASMSSSAKVPVTKNSVCTKCATARARAIKAHQESEEAQAATTELRRYVDEIEAVQQRLWQERSTQVAEIGQLRDKLAEKVEECVLIEAECTKLDKQMKTLQPETDFGEIFTQQVEDKELADEATQCTLQQSCDDGIKADQLREIATLKEEIQLLVQQLDAREQQLNEVVKYLQDAQNAAKGEKEQHELVLRLRLDDESKHKRRISELEQTLEVLQTSFQNLQQAHQKELRLIQEDNLQLRKELVAKELTARVQEQHYKDENIAREQHHQTLVKALKVRIEQKIGDVDRLHALVTQHAAEKSSSTAMKKKIEGLELQIQTLVKENGQLMADNILLQQQCAEELALIERDKLRKEKTPERSRLTEVLAAAEQENRLLQNRVTDVEAELVDQISLMEKQKRSHARALERLLESSLRLCVVAPTVHVQLNTNGVNLTNKTSTSSTEKVSRRKESNELVSVMCRSTPQQESIKRVIENDVLPLFTSVFLQGDDNESPQANVSMTRWLQDLLHDMQARIAAQLESIYSTTSATGSE